MPLRVKGWQEEDLSVLEGLLWLHAIKCEECYGIKHCSENLEYSFHLSSDIRCHSSSDNYWCFVYERLVQFYKLQSTNQKTLCKTFADRTAQLYFVEYFLEFANVLPTTDQSLNFTSDINSHIMILAESTHAAALALKEKLTSSLNVPSNVKEMSHLEY